MNATRVVLSYPEQLSEWGRRQVEAERYRTYLRRTVEDLTVGHEWEEFVDVGCCGSAMDVPLRVEAVEGPPRMGPETDIAFTTRDAEMAGGRAVQSAGGPE